MSGQGINYPEIEPNRCFAAALEYHHRGMNPLPLLPRSKAPAVSWGSYQEKRISLSLLQEWADKHLWNGVALILGRVSHLIVFDCDSPELHSRLEGLAPATWVVQTGSGNSYHLYAQITDNQIIHTRHIDTPWGHLDLQGEGAYVVAPPSIHPATNKPYTFLARPEHVAPYSEFSDVFKLLNPFISAPRKSIPDLLSDPIAKGERNNSATRIAGKLWNMGVSPEDLLLFLEFWNEKRCSPPLSRDEITQVWKSVMRYDRRDDSTTNEVKGFDD
jgi:hypothetical protein